MEKISLSQEQNGFGLLVKIYPSSIENKITGSIEGRIKIRIKKPASKGKANKELINYLSKLFNLPKKNIYIQKGNTTSLKKIIFSGIPAEGIQKIISKNMEQ